MKTLIQCDFDGTITEDDASFYLLDAYAEGDWRSILKEYKEGRITVGEFNTRAFAMIKADESTLLSKLDENVRVRPGFRELLDYCAYRGFRFVIVSNGLQFYVEAILRALGVNGIEAHAATNAFERDGVRVQYVAPDGTVLQDGFKEAYMKLYLSEGYRVVYVGNGTSDSYASRHAHVVFATGDLLTYYLRHGLPCIPFDDLTEVVNGLTKL
ncbi:MAG: MtnX-like HAD-IB family phosphatase [Dehalococcoidia bacterium]|jgi:2-hydroxy-3-keto-5-methylthiopentenyl-1-phosphate phosphatase|nr:MtnX-like HAD-IB family phosphatase [Dehalococcoidia bacterium]